MASAPVLSARPVPGDPVAIEWLARRIAANRFLPVPPRERCFVGDGDYRSIGAEFLSLFVQLGHLAPTDQVLDVGCGIGRMAVPLTQYLEGDGGCYEGIDVVVDGIDWCRRAITVRYPGFRFRRLDAFHPEYNPGGRPLTELGALPYGSAGFDFAVLTSVITHLHPGDVKFYAAELGRLLRPGGRAFLSLFLLSAESRAALAQGDRRLAFEADDPATVQYSDPAHPLAAVAYDEAELLAWFAAAGLSLFAPVTRGTWSGLTGTSYQDICVLAKA